MYTNRWQCHHIIHSGIGTVVALAATLFSLKITSDKLSNLFVVAVSYAVICVHFHFKYIVIVKIFPVKRP